MLVDSNVLIRVLTDDVPELAERGRELLDSQPVGSVMVEAAVLTEVCFVLEFHEPYHMNHHQIARRLVALLGSLPFAEQAELMEALALYEVSPKLDFTDCLLITKAHSAGTGVITFDEALAMALI